MTNAISSSGTLIQIGDGATPTEAFTSVAEVLDITGPSLSRDTEDVTSHDSGGFREFIATLADAGEVTFEVNLFFHTTQELLRTKLETGVTSNYRVVFPTDDDDYCLFAGIVTEWSPEAPVEGALTSSVTIKITGQPDWDVL